MRDISTGHFEKPTEARNLDRMHVSPVLTPTSASRPSAASGSEDIDVSASNMAPDAQRRRDCSARLGPMPAKRERVWPGILFGVMQPLGRSRRQRHDNKTVARGYLLQAMQIDRGGNDTRRASHKHLALFVSHCEAHHLDIEHEMERALASSKHPLTQLVEAEDFAGLAILAPVLDSSDHGSTLVRRTPEGIYIGEGKKVQSRNGEVALAEGRGILMLTDGRRIEGAIPQQPTREGDLLLLRRDH